MKIELDLAVVRRVDARVGEDVPALDISGDALLAAWSEMEAIPVVTERHEDGIDHSWGGLDLRTFVRGEQSSGRFSIHSIRLAPGSGLPAHYLTHGGCYAFVVDGGVDVALGEAQARLDVGGLAFAPTLTRLRIANALDRPATLILLYSPAGMDRAFEAANRFCGEQGTTDPTACHDILSAFGLCFDDRILPNDARINEVMDPVDLDLAQHGDLARLREAFYQRDPVPRLIATPADEFRPAPPAGTFRKELINGDDTAGEAMVNLLSGAPGFTVRPHFQPTEEEIFFIAEGRLHMACGTAEVALSKGGVAFCPRNTTHAFSNREDHGEARFFTFNSPAGHERAMAKIRRLSQERKLTPDEVNELAHIGGFHFYD